MSDVYDYVVVGSGSSGAVIAARLSESGAYKVLCLEAGSKGTGYIWTKPPTGNIFMVDNPTVNWCYLSEPHDSSGARAIPVPRGKILGGSSTINGTVCTRGQAIDYDTWAQKGCTGWSYDDVLPYFRKLESAPVGDDALRGRSGPVRMSVATKTTSPFYDLFIRSANAAGVPSNPDYNGATQYGVAMAQNAIARGVRESTATAYLNPARKRANLTVLSGAEATALILEGKRCVGVRVRLDGALRAFRVTREVIVAGGAANSPKLLELSGIGNPDILSQHGIATLHALPGVGENLQEHYGAIMKWRFNRPGLSIARQGRGLGLLGAILRYGLLRKGFISQGLGTMRAFVKSSPELEDADILIAAAPFIMEMTKTGGRRMSAVEGFFLYTHKERTESTGSIHIRSADPFDPPKIAFRFLETEGDRRISVAAVRKAREIVEAAPLADAVAEELSPGRDVQSDAQILDFLRTNGTICHHMVGTCRMGTDPMAVVDPRLRVHGLEGLGVADASIMPAITSGNTSIPCMMIGEKCAAMVLEDAAA